LNSSDLLEKANVSKGVSKSWTWVQFSKSNPIHIHMTDSEAFKGSLYSNGIYLYSQSTNASQLQYYTTKNVTAKTDQTK